MSVAIDFDLDTPMDEPAGYVFFDTDQDPETGFPPEEFAGLPEQDIGLDYFADLFGIHDPDEPGRPHLGRQLRAGRRGAGDRSRVRRSRSPSRWPRWATTTARWTSPP